LWHFEFIYIPGSTSKTTTAFAFTIIRGNIEYMVCNDKECLPPKKVAFDLQLQ